MLPRLRGILVKPLDKGIAALDPQGSGDATGQERTSGRIGRGTLTVAYGIAGFERLVRNLLVQEALSCGWNWDRSRRPP